ncbi:hypothetical protein PMKS-001047 [Pichia membranifaciens]|uniref:Uncharacterized protein n=1 Tax=Pichia membranifaciens TaxID=4926 RepID=A0A1Q2YDG2_9ASCO|nr:hypothetical protein PMKS-001047 [Pichia membranifaciens]
MASTIVNSEDDESMEFNGFWKGAEEDDDDDDDDDAVSRLAFETTTSNAINKAMISRSSTTTSVILKAKEVAAAAVEVVDISVDQLDVVRVVTVSRPVCAALAAPKARKTPPASAEQSGSTRAKVEVAEVNRHVVRVRVRVVRGVSAIVWLLDKEIVHIFVEIRHGYVHVKRSVAGHACRRGVVVYIVWQAAPISSNLRPGSSRLFADNVPCCHF